MFSAMAMDLEQFLFVLFFQFEMDAVRLKPRFSNENIQNKNREERHWDVEQNCLELIITWLGGQACCDQGHERSIKSSMKRAMSQRKGRVIESCKGNPDWNQMESVRF